MKTIYSTIILFSLIITSGCGIKVTTSGPHKPDEQAIGVRYYLPEDIIVITAKKEKKRVKRLFFKKDLAVSPETADYRECYPMKVIQGQPKVTSIDIGFRTVADTSDYYTIQTKPRWYSSGQISVNRNNSGLLTGVELISKGELDDIAVDAVKTIASIAGTAAGIPSFSPKRGSSTVSLSDGQVTCSEFIKKKVQLKKWPNGFTDLNPIHQYAIFSDHYVQNHWENLLEIEEVLKNLHNKKRSIISSIASVVETEDLEKLKKLDFKRELIDDQLDVVQEELQQRNSVFLESINRVTKSLQLGTNTEVADLSYAMPVKFWTPKFTSDEKTQIFSELQREIKFERLTQEVKQRSDRAGKYSGNKKEGKDTKDDGYIYYRDKVPYLYSVWIPSILDGGTVKPAQLTKQGYVELFNAETTPGIVKYEASTTGDRTLNLTYGKSTGQGNTIENTYALNSATLTYSSSGAAVASAAYNATTGAVDEFQKAQKKVFDIKTQRRAEELAQIKHDITIKENQKDYLLKELELQGTTESSDLILEKAKLDYEITTLNARKDKLESEFNLNTYAANSELNLKQDIMTNQLEVLKLQIKLLQEKNKLKELENEKDE